MALKKRLRGRAAEKARNTEMERLRGLADADNDHSDIPATDAAFWANAEISEPRGKAMISIRVDADVLDWYRRHARRYQALMNAVLRRYKEACEREETMKP